jgi:hypothetical protein
LQVRARGLSEVARVVVDAAATRFMITPRRASGAHVAHALLLGAPTATRRHGDIQMNARFLSTFALATLLALPAAAHQKGSKTTSLEPNLMGTFELIGVNNDSIAVLMNGMVVELKVDENTMFSGSQLSDTTSGSTMGDTGKFSPSTILSNFSIGDRVSVKVKRSMNEKDNTLIAIDKAQLMTSTDMGRTGAYTQPSTPSQTQGRMSSISPGKVQPPPPGKGGPLYTTTPIGQGQQTAQSGQMGDAEERARAAERFSSDTVMIVAPVIGTDGDKLVVDVGGFAIDVVVDNESKIGEQAISGQVSSKISKDFKAGQRLNIQVQRDGLENKLVMVNKQQMR